MSKKIIVSIVAALALVLGVGAFKASQANHLQGQLVRVVGFSCAYDNSSVQRINGGNMSISLKEGRYYIDVDFNDGSGRTWSWQQYHNGDLSFSGGSQGSFYAETTMIDLPGSDVIRTRVANNAGTVICNARADGLP
jgi:hypothetical protein